jgi:chromosome segregation ATPase
LIESLMVFALGVLVAVLFGLMIFPALNARAERLARRRVEALFPMSIDELTAEKDGLRAEFAVLQRRLERKADAARSGQAAEMEELGRRAVRIEALTSEIAARDLTIAATEGERDAARAKLAATEAELSAAKSELEAARNRLATLEPQHTETLAALEAARAAGEALTQRLGATEGEREAARADTAARAAAHAELTQRHDRTLQDLDARRITISDLETRLATERARAEEAERRLAAERVAAAERPARPADEAAILADNEDLRRRIAALADQMLAAEARAPAA